MSALSEMPAAGAFVAANGEFAWRRQDIEPALNAIRDSGCATLGGEVWLITGEHSWDGLIPSLGGGPPAIRRIQQAADQPAPLPGPYASRDHLTYDLVERDEAGRVALPEENQGQRRRQTIRVGALGEPIRCAAPSAKPPAARLRRPCSET